MYNKWCAKLIGMLTNSENTMIGQHVDVVTCIVACAEHKVLQIWCDRITSTLSLKPRPKALAAVTRSSSPKCSWSIYACRTSSSSTWTWNAQRRPTVGSTSSTCLHSTSSIGTSWSTTPRKIVSRRCRRTSGGLSPIRSRSPSIWSTSCSPSCKGGRCCLRDKQQHAHIQSLIG